LKWTKDDRPLEGGLMDFYQILSKETKDKSGIELYPDFIVGRSQDLMVQGRTFYAIWDEEKGLWSRDEYDVQRLVDEHLEAEADRLRKETGMNYIVRSMRSFNSQSWSRFRKFLQNISDNNQPLDSKLLFSNSEVTKKDYASRKLSYPLEAGDISAWDELVGTLYSVDERAKIEWAIGSIVSGDSKKLQKFFVFYGPAGSGKSTILNILHKLFEGYTTTFDGKALGRSDSTFSTEAFKNNPLVAIQHDGDLSRLEDNTRLNSIVAHEQMMMNEKYKPSYSAKSEALLFLGSNQPVKITDAKSGIIRRLIDIHPTGTRIPVRHYNTLLSQIDFELGAIASHCLQVYLEMGKNAYNGYRPLEMMLQTDVFFNFIEAYYDVFKAQNYTTLKQAYGLYKEFCSESGIDRPLPQYKIREELRNYFDEFKDRGEVDEERVRSLYLGFNAEKFKVPKDTDEDLPAFSLVMDERKSLLDDYLADQQAQEANEDGTPTKKWRQVKTKLSDIDTSKLHYVRVPDKHIVIDFDLKNLQGNTSLERNLEAASQWPPTYAELSKSKKGVHLHYEYSGNPHELAPVYSEGIEVKVYTGDASLRRLVSRCNSVPVATIHSGLPLKQKKEKMLKAKTITTEKGLRELIERNLRKEIHPGTKPSIDFIAHILEEAHEDGLKYDVTDMRPRILAFANNSTHQASTCLKTVQTMQFKSGDELSSDAVVEIDDQRMAIFDVEVYPNLFVVCWKFRGDDTVVRMINPSREEIENLVKLKLVGFYNRRYDNHILYAAILGYSNQQLFELTRKIVIDNNRNAFFAQAYNLSYADVWDFSSIKQGLKKFEIDLDIHHMELDFPLDQPVDEQDWPRVVEYCVNDVLATEAVLEDRWEDFVARQILAELSGLTINDTTQRHTAKIIFGDDKDPQQYFTYTDLAQEFEGYEFDAGKSSYRGEDPGEGGYIHSEPGIYANVALLDIASMHPTTIEILNLFGKYTQKFSDLKNARMAIKRKDFKTARKMLNGRLTPYLENEDGADKLAYALKIVINIVYGLTSAKFNNPFRDNRNKDNIVAKRGALYMIDLKNDLQEAGHRVIHIKTDSVKIPDVTAKAIRFVVDHGKRYGYDFEVETTYDKLCLVNDAVYIARKGDTWTAVGSQFQHPYVYKILFSNEELVFKDFCESKNVIQGTMYLDREDHEKEEELDYRRMRHLGRTGRFVPVLEGGGTLYRVKEDKYYLVTGTKGHKWIDAEIAQSMPDLKIDMSYFEKLKAEAIKTIEGFGSFQEFVG
jgi:energy-coupling factor transporter ATP-binding protein EcfA2